MSPKEHDDATNQAIQAMTEAARDFYHFGWMPGASGNLSARLDPDRLLITASGVHKRSLSPDDFVKIDASGKVAKKAAAPSIDTQVHLTLHQHTQGTGAVYHVHHLAAAICSDRDRKGGFTYFDSLEMLRVFGLEDPEVTARIPILENHRDREKMADAIREALAAKGDHVLLPCVNVLHHGIYVWAPDTEKARRYLETCAYLFSFSQSRPMHPTPSTSVSGFRF